MKHLATFLILLGAISFAAFPGCNGGDGNGTDPPPAQTPDTENESS